MKYWIWMARELIVMICIAATAWFGAVSIWLLFDGKLSPWMWAFGVSFLVCAWRAYSVPCEMKP